MDDLEFVDEILDDDNVDYLDDILELDDEELDYICDYCKKSRKVFFIILGVVIVAFTIGMLIKDGVL